ncbi:MAG: Oligopeptide-binding protein OppA [Chlamydiales bacterium]|nr:Oligopeptide-binding protein OppA [Chlamydiales bacterium]MCH9620370.1 Oligopeptide-binding protein OppA [Chlamydiales bacterium]MCH9622984.1 Oligopeptide-binding protein OppA [Chlamydiales bacterium]
MRVMKFLFFLCLTLASCQKSPTSQQVSLNFHSEPASLDPRLVRDLPSLTACRLLYDGLFRASPDGPTLALAKTYHLSEDKKTYRFTLRPTFWSDGTAVTAFDFEYGWKSLLSPHFPAESANLLFGIKNSRAAKQGKVPLTEVGVWAEGGETLVVELTHPNPFFIDLLTHPISFPFKEEEVFNGPFDLIHWQQGSELCVKKNPTYWDAEVVRLEKITITMIEDEHTELNMYENGELDWAGSPNSSLPPEALPSLKATCPDELFTTPIAGTYCYKFNTLAPPFNCTKIRQAFALAVNRKDLIDNLLQANQAIATQLIPPCLQEPVIAQLEKGSPLQLFEEGLTEMGWTRETLPSITLIFSRSEKHQKVAQAVQQQWSSLFKIPISLQSYEWNSFIDRLAKRNYQVGGRSWISDSADPLLLLEQYKYPNEHQLGGGNDTGWENLHYTALLDEATLTTNLDQRHRLIEQAQRSLLEESPIAPLYHSTACYLKKPHLQGVFISKFCELDFKHAYLKKSECIP